ncbi:HAD family phosphatase [Halorubellus sp. PRR65]|uniref:HAD family hydrolase n=1 Tax=Halorubellus sp. PRR65 TaxID=3098148 RepID=UPI002B258B5C|nr:HAD family phosphatase [Halorubellus sp. PRR65]
MSESEADPADRRIDAVIFDMDGVLVESESYWSEEMHDIIDAAYPEEADVTPADLTGVSIYDQYDRFGADHDMNVSREAYFDLYDDVAESIYLERADVTEGAADLVRDLQDAGLPVGLATSSFPQWVAWTLERLGLEDAFDAEVLAPELDEPGKPEPFVYEAAARRLGVAPEHCLVVEDSASGIEAAKRAGAVVLAYRSPDSDGEQDVSRADAVADGPAELRERVRSLALDEP